MDGWPGGEEKSARVPDPLPPRQIQRPPALKLPGEREGVGMEVDLDTRVEVMVIGVEEARVESVVLGVEEAKVEGMVLRVEEVGMPVVVVVVMVVEAGKGYKINNSKWMDIN